MPPKQSSSEALECIVDDGKKRVIMCGNEQYCGLSKMKNNSNEMFNHVGCEYFQPLRNLQAWCNTYAGCDYNGRNKNL